MTRTTATWLAAFAGLVLMVFGLTSGLGERLLEPRGITENAYTSERDQERSPVGTDTSALSCGSPWAPFDTAPDEDSPEAHQTESELSSFGVERCEALMAGDGLHAALLVASGGGVWVILLISAYGRWERRRWKDGDPAEKPEPVPGGWRE